MKDTLFGLISNIPRFEEKGVMARNIAAVIIVDGLKPFLSTYDKEENQETRDFVAPFFNKD